MRKPVSIPLRYRLGVLSRCLAASLGGYALTNAVTAFIARVLPAEPVQAATAAMMLGFVVYVLAVIWVFACRNALSAWLGVGAPTLLLALGDLGLYQVAVA